MPLHSILTDRLSSTRGFSFGLIAAFCVLVVGQIIVIATLGRLTLGPLFSDVIQLALGLICILACTAAFRRSSGIARFLWRVLMFAFVVWAVAQALAVYVDVSGHHSQDSLADTLFFLSAVPFGMLSFLDPDGELNSFDGLHILDFVQVGILAVSVFLCFSPRMWSLGDAFRLGHLTWSRNIAFDGLLAATFVLRVFLTKSKAVRWLFGRMALFLLLSGLADSYNFTPGQDLPPGGWFDLVWSALLGFPILMAGTWKNSKERQIDGSSKLESIVINRVLPLLYPLVSFLVLTQIHRAYPVLSFVVFAVAFMTFAARMLVIQHRQGQSNEQSKLRSAALEAAANAIVITNSQGSIMWVNGAFTKMTGYSKEEVLGKNPSLLKSGNQPESYYADLWSTVSSGKVWQGEIVNRRKDGTIYTEEMTITPVMRDSGNPADRYFIAIKQDITARKNAQQRVQYLALYDDLTSLPNRTLFLDRLTTALADARRQNDKIALLFLDLDKFKNINDSLGHAVGDLLLQEVGERLKKCGREQDTAARLGGDEFLIMLTHIKDVSDAAIAAERFMDTMITEFVIQGHSITTGCSLGISIFPEHGADCETLIKNADAAMYSAKADGRNNFRFFTDDMNAEAAERLTLESNLRLALAKEQLFLMYQPQMDISTGKIIGLEALLRWQDPELGLVPPDKFIRIAENSGLIVSIGGWVLRTACAQARKWQEDGLPGVSVAVNVSAVQFRQEGFCELIRKVLQETELPPQYLELELTESLLAANAELMLSVAHELRDMGVRLAIDDFGTGYSSFSYLKQFPVSKLKIDRSFVRDVAANPDDGAITTAIISMAKRLKLKVIAEGVEDEAQMSFLGANQCDEIQGYYFSKPLMVDKVADKLRSHNADAQARAQASGAQS